MDAIFRFFVVNWRFSFVLTGILALAGVIGITSLQREAFPPVNFAAVSITTIYPGASPEEVEERVTNKIEDELRSIEGIKDVRSTSGQDRSEISVRVDIDRDDSPQIINNIQRAVQRASASLPAEILEAPRVLEINAKEIPVVEVALTSETSPLERDRFGKALQKKLEDIRGVSSVRLTGYRATELQVLLDPQKMAKNYVSLAEITNAISQVAKNVPAGYLRNDETIKLVRVLGQSKDPSDVGNIVVRANFSGNAIRVRDVATVRYASEEAKVLGRFNSKPATLVIATKKPDADAYSTVNSIMAAVEEFKTNLPQDIEAQVYNNEGRRIANRLDIVINNGATGMAIVLLVLFLFLPGKIGIMSSLSLPICIAGTVAFMVYGGATFNIITMLALIICLGNLVDNSVVVSEHYTHLRETGEAPVDAAVQAAKQFWIPFTASTITIIAAFLPMLVTKGVMGQFIRWIPLVVTGALVVSLLEALILLPARLQFFHPKLSSEKSKNTSYFSKLEQGFANLIRLSLKHKFMTASFLTGMIISGFVVTAKFNRFELFPAEGVEYYVARFEHKVGTNLQKTDASVTWLSQAVEQKLGNDTVKGVIGRAGIQQAGVGDPQAKNGEHVGFLMIAIDPKVAPVLNPKDVLESLRSIPPSPGMLNLSFESLAGGPPVGKPLTVTLRGVDYEDIRKLSDQILATIATIPGVSSAKDDEILSGKEWSLRPDPTIAKSLGVNIEAIGFSLRNALQGFTASTFNKNGDDIDVVIKLDDEKKSDLQNIKKLDVNTNTGKLVSIASLAAIKDEAGPSTRKHFNYRRSITITADVDPGIITSQKLNKLVREFVTKEKANFPNVTVNFGGEEENTKESLQSLAIALLLAVVGIFATLVFTFKSFTKPALILSSIPLGLIGVFYAFALDQRPLSFLAFIGVIGLSGVVINSAIILVDYIEELRRELSHSLSLTEILVTASSRRLRAVLATGLTTVVGLLPTAFSFGGYDPILVPMTLALSWGMIVGTVLSLVWIPVGYVWLDVARNAVMGIFKLK